MSSSIRREYRYVRVWERRDAAGIAREYSEVFCVAGRDVALELHHQDCRGGWVTSAMSRPRVTELEEWHIPDDDGPSTMARLTPAGTIKHGVDLYDTAPVKATQEPAA